MTIEKRKLARIILLNCLTLGIYGAVTYQKIGNEIDALCDGDGEKPKFGYMGAVLIGIVCPIYRLYWWYRQASRIRLNANRYGLVVREKGVDTLLLRTVGEIPMIVATYVSLCLHLLLPTLVLILFGSINFDAGHVAGMLMAVPLYLFWPDFTAGAYFSTYLVIKNINRIVDSGETGTAFDPQAYEYEPAIQDQYLKVLPELVGSKGERAEEVKTAFLEATRGSNKGYSFELRPWEEVIIGRNPMEASVVIDSTYDQVSGRHVGVMYEPEYDSFRVVDYSRNGTWVDGQKLETDKHYRFGRGAQIELVEGKNSFRLK